MKKAIIHICIILLLMLSFQLTVFARAGGGGSSGGGSGGSSGGSSSHTPHGRNNTSGTGNSSALITLLQIGGIILITSGGFIFLRIKALKLSHVSKDILRDIERLEGEWNYKYLQKSVVEGYYIIQKSWALMDLTPAADYLSESLYESFRAKLEWMAIRHERPIQDHVKLVRAYPIAIHNEHGQENDYIWYYIEGSMIGYYMDTDTRNVVRGNTKPERFIEYWKFVKQKNRWMLDEIMQKEDADIESFASK